MYVSVAYPENKYPTTFETAFDKSPFEMVVAANNYVNLIAENPDMESELLNHYVISATELLNKAMLYDPALCYAYVSHANLKLWLYWIKNDQNLLYQAVDFIRKSEQIDKYYKDTYFYSLETYFLLKKYGNAQEVIDKYGSYFAEDKKDAYFIAWEVCLLLFSQNPKNVRIRVEEKINKIIASYSITSGYNIEVDSIIYLWATAIKKNGYSKSYSTKLPLRKIPPPPIKKYYPFSSVPTISVHHLKTAPIEELIIPSSQLAKIANRLKNILKNSVNHRFEVIEVFQDTLLKDEKLTRGDNPAYLWGVREFSSADNKIVSIPNLSVPDYQLIVRVFGNDMDNKVIELNISILAGGTKLVMFTKDIKLKYKNAADNLYSFIEEDLQVIVGEIEAKFARVEGKILNISGDFIITDLGRQQIFPGMKALVLANSYVGKNFEEYSAELIFTEVYENSAKALILNHDNRVTLKLGDLLRTK